MTPKRNIKSLSVSLKFEPLPISLIHKGLKYSYTVYDLMLQLGVIFLIYI